MSDEQGTASVAPTTGAGNSTETNAQSAATANANEQFYAGTYKTREDAEKGLREKELAVNRAFAERDKWMAKVNELTATLQKAVEGRVEPKQPPMIDREALAKEVDEKGGRGVLEVLERFAKETDAEYERRLSEVRREYDGKLNEVQKYLRDRDPEYLQNRDKVVEMAERMGLDPDQNRDLLMKVVKEVSRNASPGRPDIPGNTAAPNVARPVGTPTIDPMVQKAMEASEYLGKLRPEEIAKLAATSADTMSRIRRVVRQ